MDIEHWRDTGRPLKSLSMELMETKLPNVLKTLAWQATVEELQAPAGARSIAVPLRNGTTEYELQIDEDPTFVTLHTEVARIRTGPPADFYRELHSVNNDAFEGKLVLETGIAQEDDRICDSVQLTRQIRKNGVPISTLIEEVSSFDFAMERVFPQVQEVIRATGAQLLPGTASLLDDADFSILPAINQITGRYAE